MLGRALLRFPVRSRLLPPAPFQCQHDMVPASRIALAIRAYSTPGRPKSVVGEPSRPVKRAVKKAAREPLNGESPAEQLVQAKRRNASRKRSLTPEQKEARKEKVKVAGEKAKLKELKKIALDPPHHSLVNAWQFYIGEGMAEKLKGKTSGTTAEKRQATGQAMRELAAAWKNLTAAELEHYNHLSVERRAASAAEYKAWVESHSPDEIHRANQARASLRLKLEKEAKDGKSKAKVGKWAKIEDERAVKRPVSAFAQFSANRHASGDFRNIALPERAKLISQEWKALDEYEKKKYHNLYEQEHDRYLNEFKDTYGYAATPSRPVAITAAA